MKNMRELMLIQMVFASPFERAIAWLIDQIFLGLITVVPIVLAMGVSYTTLTEYQLLKITQVAILSNLIYFTISEGAYGQSLGKRLLGITVYGDDGEKAGFRKALLRRVGMVASIFMFFDVFAILMTTRRQRIFDMAAGTAVVKRRSLSSAKDYLKGKNIDGLLSRFGVPTKIKASGERVERELKRMEELLGELKARRVKREISKDEYLELKEKYERRMEELRDALQEEGQ
jgi:uncharacterized RDD family membrane protein YckC